MRNSKFVIKGCFAPIVYCFAKAEVKPASRTCRFITLKREKSCLATVAL